ncbi:MAG: FtsX-like permease family protein [Actinomycetaceae bacterium]|nr:FtsX-like permease family protein [Actinomycetaceae bacterium]
MNALRFSFRLACARFHRSKGVISLDVFSVTSYAVSTWILTTIVSGTLMFVYRVNNPPEQLAKLVAEPTAPTQAVHDALTSFTSIYVILAAFACALVVAPIFSLAAGAARVGAQSKQQRFSALRLVGMTSREVTSIALVESLIQACIGIFIGLVIYGISIPVWSTMSFQTMRIRPHEMALNWQSYLAVGATIIIISILATLTGLSRVKISPLGVSRRATPPAVRVTRLIVFIAAVIAFPLLARFVLGLPHETFAAVMFVGVVLAVLIGVFLLFYYYVGAWMVQQVGRMSAQTRSVPRLLAARRIVDDPKTTWRTQAALGIIVVIIVLTLLSGVFDAAAPESSSQSIRTLNALWRHDILQGEAITIAIALILLAFSTLSSQASSLFDNETQTRCLAIMGIERSTMTKTRLYQLVIPLVFTIVLGLISASVVSLPFLSIGLRPALTAQVWVMIGVAAVGIALCISAVFLLIPLEKTLYSEHSRKND